MLRRLVALAGTALFLALPVSAQERVNVDVDNPQIHIEINKARLIQLDENADVVLIANPEIADVVVNSPRTIFLLGKQRGKTSLFILGIDGQDILRSEVIVKEAAVPVGPKAVGIAGPKVIKLYRSVTPESVVLPATQ